MFRFFLETINGDYYQLNSTTNVKYGEQGSITDHVVEDGSTISDHYKDSPATMSLSGTITSVNTVKSPEQVTQGLIRLKRDKIFVTVYSVAMLQGTKNCLIENVEFEHTDKRPVIDSVISAKVNITLRQVRVGARAKIDEVPKEAIKDYLTPPEKKPSEKKEPNEGEEGGSAIAITRGEIKAWKKRQLGEVEAK
ncbi:MAG: hypothetical protein KUG81_09055 [Gammaproteobacteria bacterium]|nr:hypothetical protein [Gammaproteobacteria bacterium]